MIQSLVMRPGEDIIIRGIKDLVEGKETIDSLLVSIGAPRLRRAGFSLPEGEFTSPEHRLYKKLHELDPAGAHSQYNALIRRLVSFERSVECETERTAKR